MKINIDPARATQGRVKILFVINTLALIVGLIKNIDIFLWIVVTNIIILGSEILMDIFNDKMMKFIPNNKLAMKVNDFAGTING